MWLAVPLIQIPALKVKFLKCCSRAFEPQPQSTLGLAKDLKLVETTSCVSGLFSFPLGGGSCQGPNPEHAGLPISGTKGFPRKHCNIACLFQIRCMLLHSGYLQIVFPWYIGRWRTSPGPDAWCCAQPHHHPRIQSNCHPLPSHLDQGFACAFRHKWLVTSWRFQTLLHHPRSGIKINNCWVHYPLTHHMRSHDRWIHKQ